jgi:hypothetical protein
VPDDGRAAPDCAFAPSGYETPHPGCRITQSGAALPQHVASQPLTSAANVISSARSSAILFLIDPRCFSAKIFVSLQGSRR